MNTILRSWSQATTPKTSISDFWCQKYSGNEGEMSWAQVFGSPTLSLTSIKFGIWEKIYENQLTGIFSIEPGSVSDTTNSLLIANINWDMWEWSTSQIYFLYPCTHDCHWDWYISNGFYHDKTFTLSVFTCHIENINNEYLYSEFKFLEKFSLRFNLSCGFLLYVELTQSVLGRQIRNSGLTERNSWSCFPPRLRVRSLKETLDLGNDKNSLSRFGYLDFSTSLTLFAQLNGLWTSHDHWFT